MTGKENPHKPTPHLPEALHPEIGNGAMWTDDPHEQNLREADPSIALDKLLFDDEERNAITRQWNNALQSQKRTEELPTETPAETALPKSKQKEKKITLPGPERDPEPDWMIPEDKLVLKEDPNNPFADEETGNEIKPEKIAETLPEQQEKVTVEGKRVRKAIKKAKKSHKAKESAASKPSRTRPDLGLSPYTSWLKSLHGSEYVHPYEDDFGLEQLSSSTREGISETFADLLAAQGYREQAIEMYQLLMAKYPEKSSFFAAKIEALK